MTTTTDRAAALKAVRAKDSNDKRRRVLQTMKWTVSSLVDRQLILPGSADRRNGYGIDTTSVHR